MKALIVSFVFLGFAFFVGCQDSITDPVTQPTYSSFSTDEDIAFSKDWLTCSYPNIIKLEGTLLDPSQRPNGYVEIFGVLRFGIKEVNEINSGGLPILSGSTPPLTNFKVNLYVKADFKGGVDGQWKVAKTDAAVISRTASSEQVYIFEKSFRVQKPTRPALDLVLKFEVRNKSMKLISQTLRLVTEAAPIVEYQ